MDNRTLPGITSHTEDLHPWQNTAQWAQAIVPLSVLMVTLLERVIDKSIFNIPTSIFEVLFAPASMWDAKICPPPPQRTTLLIR